MVKMTSTARNAVKTNNFDDAIADIEEAKKWEEESKRAISAVAVTPNTNSVDDKSLTNADVAASK